MDRSQFTFYASFARAISRIRDPGDRVMAYDALIAYALNGVEPDLDDMPDSVAVALEVSMPVLDSARKKARAGKSGGSKSKANASKPKANASKAKAMEDAKQEQGQEQEQVKEQVQVQGKDKEQMLLSSPSNDVEDIGPTPTSPAAGAYMKKINPMPSTASMRELLEYERELGSGVCLKAIDAALDAGARSWNYVRSVLQAKKIQGIRSVEDWDRQEAARMDAKQRRVADQIMTADENDGPSDVDWFLDRRAEGGGA